MQSIIMNTWCFISVYIEKEIDVLYVMCVFPSSVCEHPEGINLASISWFLKETKERNSDFQSWRRQSTRGAKNVFVCMGQGGRRERFVHMCQKERKCHQMMGPCQEDTGSRGKAIPLAKSGTI